MGAVDKRVIGMVPVVIPVLNLGPSFNHHYQAYGRVSLINARMIHFLAFQYTYIDSRCCPVMVMCLAGGWSFPLQDYVDEGVMKYLNTPQFLELAAIIDPWEYRSVQRNKQMAHSPRCVYLHFFFHCGTHSHRDRLTVPKMVLSAAGDEFFLLDSPQFFINGLLGDTHLNVMQTPSVGVYIPVTHLNNSMLITSIGGGPHTHTHTHTHTHIYR